MIRACIPETAPWMEDLHPSILSESFVAEGAVLRRTKKGFSGHYKALKRAEDVSVRFVVTSLV